MSTLPVVTSPPIGASKTAHIDDAVASFSLMLAADETASLEEPCVQLVQYGFR